MAVDEAGWAEVAAVFAAAGNRLEAIHALCRRRIEQSGDEATPLVVGMAAFEPAPDDWVPDPAMEAGGSATNGAGPEPEGAGDGEGAANT
jgi:hypothetical protein